MEEKRLCGSVLEGLNSSELCICGGVAASVNLSDIIAIIRKVMEFLDDYVPQLIKGFKDGYKLSR